MTENNTAQDVLNSMAKQTYNHQLGRLGYFCDICECEVRNESGLVHFESSETVQALNVCHDCLPEGFE